MNEPNSFHFQKQKQKSLLTPNIRIGDQLLLLPDDHYNAALVMEPRHGSQLAMLVS